VVVESLNIVKKHQRAQQAGNRQVQGGIIEKRSALATLKRDAGLYAVQQATRVGFRSMLANPHCGLPR